MNILRTFHTYPYHGYGTVVAIEKGAFQVTLESDRQLYFYLLSDPGRVIFRR